MVDYDRHGVYSVSGFTQENLVVISADAASSLALLPSDLCDVRMGKARLCSMTVRSTHF